MSKLYLRNREHGEIMDYVEQLRDHPKLEIVTEEVAYPERFTPESIPETQSTRKGRARVKLNTSKIPEPPAYSNDDQNRDASRRLRT